MTHTNYNEPTPAWSFIYRDIEGAISTKSFNAVTWTQSLQEFVNFLKGLGYVISDDAIQISSDNNDDHWYGNYCDPVEEDSETDLFKYYPQCPDFEGNPNDCAFKNECDDCSCMDCDEYPMATPEDEQRLVEQLKFYRMVANDPAATAADFKEAATWLNEFAASVGQPQRYNVSY